MLHIYIENENSLILEDERRKVVLGNKPNIMSNDSDITIYLNLGTEFYQRTYCFSEINVAGTVYQDASETVDAISALCVNFKAGGGDGAGSHGGGVQSVTEKDGELLVAVDNTDSANPKIESTTKLENAVNAAETAVQEAPNDGNLYGRKNKGWTNLYTEQERTVGVIYLDTLIPNIYYKYRIPVSAIDTMGSAIPVSVQPIVVFFTSGSGSFSFPSNGISWLNSEPTFEQNTSYELSIINGIVAVSKIVS